MNRILVFMLAASLMSGCKNGNDKKLAENAASECSGKCETGSRKNLTCRLTTAEQQQRKETVLASLQKQVVEKKELANGYAFKFAGSDKMIDELTEFSKT